MFTTLFRREMVALWRSRRLVFLPLAFALLAGLQPVDLKLLPSLLHAGSNLPAGTVIRIPPPAPGIVVGSAFGEIGQVGVLLLILAAMGAIAGDRQAGVLASILSKPISRGALLLAKASSLAILATVCLLVADAAAVYETAALFGPVPIARALQAFAIYLPGLLLPLSATVAASAMLDSPLAAGGAALVLTVLLETASPYLGQVGRTWNPGELLAKARDVLGGAPASGVGDPALAALAVIALMLAVGTVALARREG